MQTDTTENNGVLRRPLQPGETAVYGELLKASPNWAARACALVALAIFAVAFYMAGEVHKARLDIEAAKDRSDVLIEHVDALVPRQTQHLLCEGHKAQLGLPRPGAVDLGPLFPCPNPDDGACVTGPDGKPMFAQLAQARCEAGKL